MILPDLSRRFADLFSLSWTVLALLTLLSFLFYLKYFKPPKQSINEPVLIPYTWPIIGHTFEFLKDQRAFYARANEKSKGEPFTVFLNNSKNYVFSTPKDVEVIYTKFNNRNHSQDDVKQFRTNILGFTSKDADKVAALRVEENKTHAKYLLKTDEMELITINFCSQLDYELQGIAEQIKNGEKNKSTFEIVGFPFAGDALIRATVAAFFGRAAFQDYVDLFGDFRTFFTVGLGYRLFGVPLLFDRSPLDAMKRIKDCLRDHVVNPVLMDDIPFDFSKYNKARILEAKNNGGLTTNGVVCNEFDIIIAGNINTIPLSYIALLRLYSDKDLLAEVRKEVEDLSYKAISFAARAKVDTKRLPKLKALFHEVLRFHSTSQSVRELKKDRTITMLPENQEGEERRTYELKKGNQLPGILRWFVKNNAIVMPSSLLHHNPNIHANPDTFDAKRFLSADLGGKGTPVVSAKLRPFGGGSSYCPGRYFAEKQIIAFLALVSMKFDIEIVSDPWEIPRNADFYYVTSFPDVRLRLLNRTEDKTGFSRWPGSWGR